ncbi:MAG: IS200/IS605 family transposase [Pyrinomonadaceae bacterium]|nr:IS200/IS605 family transposase [Pyrinomonadaceae bacterium]
MFLTPLADISWAYQLHYYLCFRTHRRRQVFAAKNNSDVLQGLVKEICQRHEYHLLDSQTYPDQFRCLLSLRPDKCVSQVIQTIKANSARECGLQLRLSPPLWARGFLARTTGRMRIGAVRQYLEQQAEHHGYASRILPPVYRYRATSSVILQAPHAVFDLSHHLVFATHGRKGVFTSNLGQALSAHWLKVACKRGFAIDQISVVPDHVHLLIRNVPKMSIESCALMLLNNAQHFLGERFPNMLINAGLDQLWQPSAYAGTCGQVSTALIKKWLSE